MEHLSERREGIFTLTRRNGKEGLRRTSDVILIHYIERKYQRNQYGWTKEETERRGDWCNCEVIEPIG